MLMDDTFKKLPNWLTFIRLFLIPVFVLILASDPNRLMVNIALVIFIIASLTDLIDGFLARKLGAVSEFGKLLDPLADKVLVISALIMLVSLRSDLYGKPWVSGPLVVLVAAREVWVTGLRGLAANQGIVVAANFSGKWKSFLQMLAIIFLFLHDYQIRVISETRTCEAIGHIILLLSIAFGLYSAYEYTMKVLFSTKEVKKESNAEIAG